MEDLVRILNEHEAVRRRLETMRELLYDNSYPAPPEQEQAVRDLIEWMRQHVLPHAEEEETTLFANFDAPGSLADTAAHMTVQHQQLRRYVQQLTDLLEYGGEQSAQRWDWVRMVAAQMEMLLSLHMQEEESLYAWISSGR